MDGADMMVLRCLAHTLMSDLQAFLRIGGEADGLAHFRIVERLLRHLHAGNRGLRRHHLVDVHMRHALIEVELLDIALIDAIDLLRGERRSNRCRVIAKVDEMQLVDIAGRIGTALEHRLAADFQLRQFKRFRAVRTNRKGAVLSRIEHQERIVEEMLRHSHLSLLEIEDEGLGILDLDRIGIPQFGGHHRIALVVLGSRIDLLEHVALHQAHHR